MGLYLMCISESGHGPFFADTKTDQWFRKAWEKTGRKLDCGKGCIRFKRLSDVPLEVVAQLIAGMPVADYIARIETVFASRKTKGSKVKVHASTR